MGTISITQPGAYALGDKHWVIGAIDGMPMISELHQVINYDPLLSVPEYYATIRAVTDKINEPEISLSCAGAALRFVEKFIDGTSGYGFNYYTPLHAVALQGATEDWSPYTKVLGDVHSEETSSYPDEVPPHASFWDLIAMALIDSAGDNSVRSGFMQAVTIARVGSGEVNYVPGSMASHIDWSHVIAKLTTLRQK